MSANGDSVDYPNENVKAVLERTVRELGFKDFDITLKLASSKGDNYLGVIYRAVVEGVKNGSKTKMNLIVKSAPTYSRAKMMIDVFYKREIYCYRVLLQTLKSFQDKFKLAESERFGSPRLYADDLKDKEEILIMEDLMDSGYTMCDRHESLTIEHVKLAIGALARFHALSFKLKQTDPETFKTMGASIYQGAEVTDLFRTFTLMSIDKAVDNVPEGSYKDKLVAFREDAVDKFVEFIMPELAGEYAVLCHGDCWTNNIMFKYEGDKPVEIQLLDWQMIKCTSPVVDIAYLIFSSTDEHLRKDHYNDLLDLYYETLSRNLAKMDCDVNVYYPRSVYKKHLEVFMPFGLIMGCVTAPLFMCEEEDVPDMNTILEKDEIENVELKSVKSQKKYEDRIRGILKDIVDFNII